MKITELQIQQIMPQARFVETWVKPLNMAMDKFNINENVSRIAAFLGQIAVESAELNRLEENLNYSRRRLQAVWPSRFPDSTGWED